MQASISHITTNRACLFFAYFTSTYCLWLPQRAVCFHTQTTINTNMYLVSIHRVLKILYLNHKQNRRIDSLLITSMRIARDKVFEHFCKLQMGKNSYRICEVNKRHKRTLLLKLSPATQIESTKWKLQSQSSPDTNYVVEKAQEN